VQHGRLYRLASPRRADGFAATEYVAGDGRQAVVFATLHSQQYGRMPPNVVLEGLEEKAVYKVADIDGRYGATLSGAALMSRGLPVRLTGDHAATAFTLEKQ
jgi:alpha-galactosidase